MFDRERLTAEREKVDMERQEKWKKWKLEKAKILEGIELEKDKLRLDSDTEDSKNMLQDTRLLDEEDKKWLLNNMKINERNNSGD